MLSPEIKEEITATLEVLQAIKVTKVGTVAGCLVREGKIKRANKVRLIRDGIVIYSGELGSLRRFKDDVKEVVTGLECGLIGDKYPGMDMISYGPTIRGAHSPDEKLEIDTVTRFWDLTLDVLMKVPEK